MWHRRRPSLLPKRHSTCRTSRRTVAQSHRVSITMRRKKISLQMHNKRITIRNQYTNKTLQIRPPTTYSHLCWDHKNQRRSRHPKRSTHIKIWKYNRARRQTALLTLWVDSSQGFHRPSEIKSKLQLSPPILKLQPPLKLSSKSEWRRTSRSWKRENKPLTS